MRSQFQKTDIVQNFSDDDDNIPKLASFKTVRIYVFRVMLSINRNCFAEQHLLNFISDEHGLRYL